MLDADHFFYQHSGMSKNHHDVILNGKGKDIIYLFSNLFHVLFPLPFRMTSLGIVHATLFCDEKMCFIQKLYEKRWQKWNKSEANYTSRKNIKTKFYLKVLIVIDDIKCVSVCLRRIGGNVIFSATI